MSVDKVICPIPWNHISVQQNGDYRICCQQIHKPFGKLTNDGTVANVKNTTIDDVRNFKEIKDLRSNMLNGIRDPSCVLCYHEEDVGIESKRNKMLSVYSDDLVSATPMDGTIDTSIFPLKYIDIRFGNLCNLKCRYCGPTDSSMWYEDYAKIQEEGQPVTMEFYGSQKYEIKKINNVWDVDSLDFKWYERDAFWHQIEHMIPHIDRYYFTGGEPTINKTHFELLQMIIDAGNAASVTLEYNTNMFAIPDKLYDQWKHFKLIEIGCSIDGLGDMANYLRPPSTWKQLERNLDKLGNHELNNIRASLSTTVSVFNVLHFIELTTWLADKNYKNIVLVPAFHILMKPECMSIQVLPPNVKQHIVKKYAEFYHKADIRYGWGRRLGKELKTTYGSILSFMNEQDQSHLLPVLHRHIINMDELRNQNLSDIIPWLHDIVKVFEVPEEIG